MSVWRTTLYEHSLEREITFYALLPEWTAGEARPFSAVAVTTPPGREPDWWLRRLPLERLAARRGQAVLCLPDAPSPALLARIERLYPVRVTQTLSPSEVEPAFLSE